MTVGVLSRVPLFVTLWTVAARLLCPQDFPRRECWGGRPVPPPGDPLTPGWNPRLLCLSHCRRIRYHWATGKAEMTGTRTGEMRQCTTADKTSKLHCKGALKRNGKGHLKREKQPRIKGQTGNQVLQEGGVTGESEIWPGASSSKCYFSYLKLHKYTQGCLCVGHH